MWSSKPRKWSQRHGTAGRQLGGHRSRAQRQPHVCVRGLSQKGSLAPLEEVTMRPAGALRFFLTTVSLGGSSGTYAASAW